MTLFTVPKSMSNLFTEPFCNMGMNFILGCIKNGGREAIKNSKNPIKSIFLLKKIALMLGS